MSSVAEIERRILKGLTAGTVLGFFLMLIATTTDYWAMVSIPQGQYSQLTKSKILELHFGLWRICRDGVSNDTSPSTPSKHCTMLNFYPTYEEIDKNPEIDSSILDYRRTVTAFAIISLILMLIGHVFVFYSFGEPRYMFKRISSFLHVMSAIAVLVTVEVFINAVVYEKSNLPGRHPPGSTTNYGFSFGLAWVAFIFYIVAGITFLICSRKRKGEKAGDERTALENLPMHLGRV